MTAWQRDRSQVQWLEALDDRHSGCWCALPTLLHDIDSATSSFFSPFFAFSRASNSFLFLELRVIDFSLILYGL